MQGVKAVPQVSIDAMSSLVVGQQLLLNRPLNGVLDFLDFHSHMQWSAMGMI